MLVLARREGEKLVLPDLDVSIEVLSLKGSAVRLGIHAPENVAVLREELLERIRQTESKAAERNRLSHAVRNRLNAATLAIHLFQKQLEGGDLAKAEITYRKMLEELRAVREELGLERARPGSPPVHGRRALVVEDDAFECELLARLLQVQGFQVATAGDGADALDYLASHEQPDVVLLDMVMPRCDGPTALRAIRGNPVYKDLKIYAISGTTPASWGICTGPSGVDRWFQKPVDPEKLLHEIACGLNSSAPT